MMVINKKLDTLLINSDEDIDDEFMRFHKLCFGGVHLFLVTNKEIKRWCLFSSCIRNRERDT